MEDVRAVPWNGYTVASLFAGAGGSSLGYRLAGFRVLYANEFIREAADVYRANAAPWTHVDERDVRGIGAEEIRVACSMAWDAMPDVERRFSGELDVLDGSPPCRSFSTAGLRAEVWGKSKTYSEDVSQRDDDLFYEYARLLAGLRPRVFVAENVTGLIRGISQGYYKKITTALADAGYVVGARVLDASRLGVPQSRKRVFIVGVRADLAARGIAPAFPTPLPYVYSLRNAMPELEAGELVEHATGHNGHAPYTTDGPMRAVVAQWIARIVRPAELGPGAGGEWKPADPKLGARRTYSPYRPAAATSSGAKPVERRALTLAELRSVCSFPADFVLLGSYAQAWERLGRAVPPLMMRALATTIRDDVLAPASGASVTPDASVEEE